MAVIYCRFTIEICRKAFLGQPSANWPVLVDGKIFREVQSVASLPTADDQGDRGEIPIGHFPTREIAYMEIEIAKPRRKAGATRKTASRAKSFAPAFSAAAPCLEHPMDSLAMASESIGCSRHGAAAENAGAKDLALEAVFRVAPAFRLGLAISISM